MTCKAVNKQFRKYDGNSKHANQLASRGHSGAAIRFSIASGIKCFRSMLNFLHLARDQMEKQYLNITI